MIILETIKSPDRYKESDEALERGILFLQKLSGKEDRIADLLKNSLKILNRLSRDLRGFEILQLSDGTFGTAGPGGNFFLKKELNYTSKSETKIDAVIVKTLRALEEHKITKFLPSLNFFKVLGLFKVLKSLKRKEFPVRKNEDPVVRLIVPNEKGFVDLEVSYLHQMIGVSSINPSYEDQSALAELLLTGEVMNKRTLGLNFSISPMSEWLKKDKKDEPLWLVLSASDEDKTMLRDPRILAHFHLKLDNLSALQVESVDTEWGHVGSDGKTADDITREVSGEEVKKPDKEALLAEYHLDWVMNEHPDNWFKGISTERIGPSVVLGKEEIKMETPDLLLSELMEELNLIEVIAFKKWPSEMYQFFQKWGIISYGKPANLITLAGALTAGQASLIPVASNETDLEVMIGLGGENLIKVMRMMVRQLRKDAWDEEDWNTLKKFWNYWERNELNKAFKEQLQDAKSGNGLVTNILRATGVRGRNVADTLSSKLRGDLANFFRSRWMISILGSGQFMSAQFEKAGATVGIANEGISLRWVAKDPLLWWEAILEMLENDRTVLSDVENIKIERMRNIAIKYKVDYEMLVQAREWMINVHKYFGEGTAVKKVPYGKLNKKDIPAKGWIRSIGSDVDTRELIISNSRAVIAIISELGRRGKSKNIDNFNKDMVNAFEGLAKKKLGWMVEHMIELSLLGKMKLFLNNLGERKIADEQMDIDDHNILVWIEYLRKNL